MTTRARAEKKHCGYCGLTFYNDGHHAEVCTGPPAFLSEPEYAKEQQADERDRRHEAYEDQRLVYPEKGI
jgi:hypothetical protein